SFNTGVVNSPINSAGVDNLPCERNGGVGTCGSREFSVPQLFDVRNLGPFFHDASAATLFEAVEFYTSAAFNNSPAGIAVGGIAMSLATINDVVAFLEGLTVGSISANSPTTVSGTPGSPVSPAPSVLVLDGDERPLAGVQVTFAITGGAGTLTGATQTTNAAGIASVGSWVLAAGGNTLTATATGTFQGNPVTFTAVGCVGSSCGDQPLLSVTPSSLDFGSVNINTSTERSFSVRNAGSGTLTGTAGASAPFSISAGGSFSLAPGASQIVTARFSPTSSAFFSGSVDFSSNGGNLSRLITGTGAGSTTVTTVTSSANP